MKPENNTHDNFCVCCGEPVPEGRMVCLSCEMNPKLVTPLRQTKPKKILKKLFSFSKERRNDPRT